MLCFPQSLYGLDVGPQEQTVLCAKYAGMYLASAICRSLSKLLCQLAAAEFARKRTCHLGVNIRFTIFV